MIDDTANLESQIIRTKEEPIVVQAKQICYIKPGDCLGIVKDSNGNY